MKQILLLISTLLILSSESKCQQEMVWGTFYLGPFISHKAGLNLNDVYPGEKKIIRINGIPDFGVTCFYSISKKSQNTGIIMEFGLTTYSFKHTLPINESRFMSSQTSSITMGVGIYLWGLSFGPTLGFPIIWSLNISDNDFIVNQQKSRFFEGLYLNYFLPLLIKDKEKLNLNFIIELNFITADEFFEEDKSIGYETNYKPNILSFGIGLNYLFKLGN